eukprot:CAMPEP_0198421876 /NCGR_PEP_ID=MMETSP1452-20131203/1965_1 /TAXON_ID=1181717 /ORGANISM="Synchroma pusillum, Strain CCMP3072" /LENGTH=119 /DNA_ID=CAMNT_0044142115 /DNA_START=1 /DNA_END=357 /DNA_ORIENTATION=-
MWDAMAPAAEAAGFELGNPRVSELRDALAGLSAGAAGVVQRVVSNALRGGDARYSTLRRGNPRVQQLLAQPGAERVLRAVGFADAEVGGAASLTLGASGGGGAADPALLYLASSLLEQA